MAYFKKIKLKNNLEAYIIKLPYPSDIVYLDIIFEDAILYEKESKIGCSHLLEHYIISLIYKNFGDSIKVKGETNIHTVRFLFDIKSNIFKKLQEILKIFVEPLNIDESILEKEKKVLIDELTSHEIDLKRKLFYLTQKSFIKSPRRLKHPIGGYPDKIKKITSKDLANFLNSLLVNGRVKVFIGIRGQNISLIESIIKKYLGNIKLTKKTLPYSKIIYNKKVVLIENWPFDEKINILLNFPGPSIFDNTKLHYAYRAFCNLFTEDQKYGVFNYLRELGIYYGLLWQKESTSIGGVISFFTKTNYENFWETLKIIFTHFKKFKTENIPKRKIRENINVTGIKDAWKTNSGFYEWVLWDLITYKKIVTPSQVIKIINSLNSEDIKKVANNFDKRHCSMIILGKNAKNLIKINKLKNYIETF